MRNGTYVPVRAGRIHFADENKQNLWLGLIGEAAAALMLTVFMLLMIALAMLDPFGVDSQQTDSAATNTGRAL